MFSMFARRLINCTSSNYQRQKHTCHPPTYNILNMDQAVDKAKAALANTNYACSSLHPLSGGSANFTFKGRLLNSLPDGTEEVLIKHGESFLASNPSSGWELPMYRCKVEEECLRDVGGMPTPPSPCAVRTPKIHHSNQETNTKVIEYLDGAMSLKDYALKHFAAPDPSRKPFCLDIGKSLGIWLRSFHEWANRPEQSRLQNVLRQDDCLQTLRHMVYYSTLVGDVERFPDILSDAKEVFEQVEKMAAEELKRDEDLVVIHGDFWTGNSLLKDQRPQDGLKPDIFIVDWEMAQYGVRPVDLAQMIAECYELSLFKNIEDGKWLIEGFVKGYGSIDDEFTFRVLINVGIHLVVWGSRAADWGTPEQVEEVVGKGKEIIVRAWHKDRTWFEAGDLACMFSKP